MTRLILTLALVLAGCESKDKSSDSPPPVKGEGEGKAAGTSDSPATGTGEPPDKTDPPPKIDGPSVTAVTTDSIAFVVPKEAAWWGEFSFACYRAVMSLTGTRSAGEAFEGMSPTVVPAMKAGDIDLGRDLQAIGGFDCDGSPCLYVAISLKSPDKMGTVLEKLLPGVPQKKLGDGHFELEAPGMKGTREIHIRVVPIQWTGGAPSDPWGKEGRSASHVVFIGGVDGKNKDVDPVTLLADAATAKAHVDDAESLLADKRNRCMLGRVGPRDFQPGYELERARFALSAPPAAEPDALMKLMDSKRTVDLQVELVLKPAPKAGDVTKWIAAGRAWMSNIATPIRGQFAAEPLVGVMFDLAAVLGERGFKEQVDGGAWRLSWRTDRVPGAELKQYESKLEALLAAP